jgi:hypothetical protein
VGALVERSHELLDHRFARGEQLRVACARREREQAPAEPVGARLRVTVDESVLREDLQRSRDLALVRADELRDLEHSQAAGAERLVACEHVEHVDAAAEARCAIRNHGFTIVATVTAENADCSAAS